MDELEKFRSRSPTADGPFNVSTADAKDLTLQAVLFKALHGFTKQTKGSNMLYNLQAAAFCLSFMLQGCTANDRLVSK
jgi:hypothetical protein